MEQIIKFFGVKDLSAHRIARWIRIQLKKAELSTLFFRMFLPQTTFQWTLFLAFSVSFYETVAKQIWRFEWLLFLSALFILVVAIIWKTGTTLIWMWAGLPRIFRIAFFGAVTYATTVLLGFWPDIRNYRNVCDLLFLLHGAPYSSVHTVALVGLWLAGLTQNWSYDVPQEILRRGPKLISHTQAQRIAKSKFKSDEASVFWGALALPDSAFDQHCCIIGESSSGKTKCLHMFLNSILPKITTGSNRRALIYDAKKDLFSFLAGMRLAVPVQTLNPFDKRSVAWNMAKDIPNAPIAIEIATVLVPERGEREPYFPDAARALLSGVIESFMRIATRRSPNGYPEWTFRDVCLALRYPSRTRVILKFTKHTRHLLFKYVGDTRTDKDIASTLENIMRRFSFVAAAWEHAKESISLHDWIENERILILGRSTTAESTVMQLNLAIFHRLSQLLRDLQEAEREKGRPPRRNWIVIDELREAGRFVGLSDLLTEGRTKGVRMVLGFQDINGLQIVYGKELAKSIVGACQNKAFLRTTDQDTKEFASSNFGLQEVDIPRQNFSSNVSNSMGKDGSSTSSSDGVSFQYQIDRRPVLLPSQFDSDLPKPDFDTGIRGYYQTALIGSPYFACLSGPFVKANVPEPDLNVLDFDPRPDDQFELKEWDEMDLERLGLKEFPELLEPEETKEPPKDAPAQQYFKGELSSRADYGLSPSP
jgi:type IV secretory pathway TraG/TraD family ATPase VirD4